MLRKALLISFVVALCATATVASATVWDVYGDFGFAANPNGAWTYGWSVTLGSAFTAFDFTDGANWTRGMGGSPTYSPYLWYNGGGIGTYPANAVGFSSGDPGEDEYTVVRWTAPTAGLYQIDACFKEMVGAGGPGSWFGRMDDHVLVNGASVFDCVTNGAVGDLTVGPGPFTFSGVYSLAAGATVDFTGGTFNGSPAYDFVDITGCKVTSVVPEPSSILAMLAGMTGLVGLLRKRS